MATRSFTLVLAGGGARGFAHVGVLRALESMGMVPAGIVGVSMGSLVAATYGLRDDWYDALLALEFDTTGAPSSGSVHGSGETPRAAVQRAWSGARAAWSLITGWGTPDEIAEAGRATVEAHLGPGRLEECRIPVTVCATDLLSGARIELSTGPASTAVIASSSLAGILPPVEMDGMLLVDGVYSDIAPVDVARGMGASRVMVVDPTQPKKATPPRNGLQVVMRAMEICHHSHAHGRIGTADLVIRPEFETFIDVLDFDKRDVCIEAGRLATVHVEGQIRALLAD